MRSVPCAIDSAIKTMREFISRIESTDVMKAIRFKDSVVKRTNRTILLSLMDVMNSAVKT